MGYFRTQQSGVYSMDFKELQGVDSNPSMIKHKNIKQKKDEVSVARCIICAGRFLIELDANLSS